MAMTPRTALATLALGLLLSSCSDTTSPEPVEIRVRNASAAIMRDVVVIFPDDPADGGGAVEPGDAESGDVSYGTLEPGASTPYRRIARAYRYAAVTVEADGVQLVLIPDDYVGETFLERGRYTYELDILSGSLALRLVVD